MPHMRGMSEKIRLADISCLNERIRDVMLSGRINAILPMSSVEEEGRTLAVYSIEDKICVAEGSFSPANVLELTGRIIKMLEELEDILIRPEDIVLSAKVIFIDPEIRKTRICVIPVKSEIRNSKENVSYLLEELKELTDDRGKAYLDIFIKKYNSTNLKVDRQMAFIEELKKEAGME